MMTESISAEFSWRAKGDHPYGNRYISVVEWRDYLDPLRVFAALDGRPFEPDGNAATDPGDG